jgi:hypothetical protein
MFPADYVKWLDEQVYAYLDDDRPDLKRDSVEWQQLFYVAAEVCHVERQLLWTLHGFRAMGAELADGKMERGEIPLEEYKQMRRAYLMPHLDTLRNVFSALLEAPLPIPANPGHAGRWYEGVDCTWQIA